MIIIVPKEAFVAKKTISSRLMLCFLTSTLIPTIVITALLCIRFDTNYRQTARNQMSISQELIMDSVDLYLSEMEAITTAPYYHSYFQGKNTMDFGTDDYLQALYDFQNEMQGLLNLTTYSRNDITDFLVWSDGHFLFYNVYNQNRYFASSYFLERQTWYNRTIENPTDVIFTPASQPPLHSQELLKTDHFYITRKIRNIRNADQNNILILNLSTEGLRSRFQDVSLLYDSFLVITNEHEELLYTTKPLTGDALAQVLSREDFRYDGTRWTTTEIDAENYPIRVRLVYSMDEIGIQTRQLVITAMAFYMIGLGAAFELFRRYNRWIGHSADKLQSTFRQAENGNLDVRCSSLEVEEFDQIGSSLNRMICTVKENFERERQILIRQKAVELYALQSQIQPHFLINTLYCFIALNQIGQKEKLHEALNSLAHLLRYVMSKDPETTIGRELDFLEDYLKLQCLRYGPRLSYEISCQEALREYTIPRLLVQPLVENAIIHGIEPCEHPCVCKIHASIQGENIHILVEDNGVGFDPAEMQRKSAEAASIVFMHAGGHTVKPSSKISVGLYYIRERLRMWKKNASLDIRCQDLTQAELTFHREECL